MKFNVVYDTGIILETTGKTTIYINLFMVAFLLCLYFVNVRGKDVYVEREMS